jgi:transposase-like protein
MVHILAEIMSLAQYNDQCHATQLDRLTNCLECGRANPWCHGCYSRKSDRMHLPDESLNPIFIQRYYCPGCGKTCSVLPECIPPRRWYLWETQQAAILLFLLGESARSIEKQVKPSRHTIKRWVSWLIVQFKLHKDTLCNHFPSLGCFTEPSSFWQPVFDKLSLSTAMRLCHAAGVSIP